VWHKYKGNITTMQEGNKNNLLKH